MGTESSRLLGVLVTSPLLANFPRLQALLVSRSGGGGGGGGQGSVAIHITPATQRLSLQSFMMQTVNQFAPGQLLKISATVLGGVSPYIVTWNFGDATQTQQGQSVQHAYTSVGTYNLTATVTDAIGNKLTGTAAVTIVQILTSMVAPTIQGAQAYGGSLYAQTGSAVTLVATLMALSPVNAGLGGETVNFYNGSQYIGSATTNSSGVATLNFTVPSTPGTLSISAQFAGLPGYAAITSATASLVTYNPLTVTVGTSTQLLAPGLLRKILFG